MFSQFEFDKFFEEIELNWKEFLEIIPLGVVIFDENWKVISVSEKKNNSKFISPFDSTLEGKSLISERFFAENIPHKSLVSLRTGTSFERHFTYISENDENISIKINGSPIFKDGFYKGGTITIDSWQQKNFDVENLEFPNRSILDVLKSLCDCYIISDENGIVKFVSDTEEQSCKFLKNKVGSNIWDVFQIKHTEKLKDIFSKVIESKKQSSLEIDYFADFKQYNFNNYFIPMKDSNDEVKSVVTFIRDVDSTKNDGISYLSNTKNLSSYLAFAEAANDLLFKLNLNGEITYTSEISLSRLKEYRENIVGKFIGVVLPDITISYFENIRAELFRKRYWEDNLKVQIENSTRFGKVKFIAAKYENTTEILVYCNLINNEEQKLITAKEEEKKFFRDTVVKSDEMILQTNPNGTILFANDKFCEEFEYTADEILGVNFADLIEDDFRVKNKITNFFSSIHKGIFEIIPLLTKTGTVKNVCSNVNLSTFASELQYFTVYLHECEEEDKLLVNAANVIIDKTVQPIFVLKNNELVNFNAAFKDLFDDKSSLEKGEKNVHDLLGLSHEDIIHFLEDKNKEVLNRRLIINSNSATSHELKKIFTSENHSYYVCSLIEINNETNKLIPPTEERSSHILSSSINWNGKINNDKIILTSISDNIEKLTGFTESEILIRNEKWTDFIHPDDYEYINNEFLSTINNFSSEVNRNNFRIITKTGEVVWVENEFELIYDETNKPVEIAGTLTDVTETTVEKSILSSRIKELEKLNIAKDKFISIISHDLKSPFTSIIGFTDYILDTPDMPRDEIYEYLGYVRDASLNTVDLLNSMIDLTKLQTGRIEIRKSIINANYLVQKTKEILGGIAVQKKINLVADIDDSIYINVDEGLIFQVFNNLVANSIKFTPQDGTISIGAKILDKEQKVEFYVKDTGVGIEPENIEKLFVVDKKFTTLGTEGERGTGLGLSLVGEIIEKHKGTIRVESEIGKGSKFIFTIPISSPVILFLNPIKNERVLYTKLIESITDRIKIIQSDNFDDAIDKVRTKFPMLILMEHNQENKFALDFIKEIKNLKLNYSPELSVIGKNFTNDIIDKYHYMGCSIIFNKPIDLKEFKERLEAYLG